MPLYQKEQKAHEGAGEHWFHSAFDAAADAILVVDDERRFVAANPSACTMLGLTLKEVLDRHIEDITPSAQRDSVEQMWEAFLHAGEQDAEFELQCEDGRMIEVDYRARANFVPGRHITFLRDIGERKRAEQSLRESEMRYRQIVETAEEGVWTVDADERTSFVNRALAEMLGYQPEELVRRPATLILPPSELPVVDRIRETLAGGETARTEVSLRRSDGGLVTTAVVVSPLRGDEGRLAGALVMVTDVSAWREAQASLGETRKFLEAIARRMAEGLVAVDGEGLITYVNVAAENMLGARAVELTGRELHAITHPSGQTVCSPGACPLLRAPTALAPIRIESDVFLRHDGSELPVSFSSAPLVPGEEAQGAVIVFSDISERKERESRDQRDLEALAWIERIREAIAEDRLVLYGQPIIDLATGERVQTELLLRMRGRDGEIIPPGAFLPIAERYGLMKEIDLWVITQAIELAASGRNYEINLSAPSIGESDVLYLIERELERTGADPSNLVFEITETALMENVDGGRRFARELTRIGCRFALDDFGTGFGSFTYLKHLPVQLLKIDMEFVRDLVNDPSDEHVITAIVNLGAGFGQTTIAEGVENQETLDRLRALGVDQAQGFHIGRPSEIIRPESRQRPEERKR